MKLQLVKDQEMELKIEDLLGAKGFKDALVYISNENVNVVVNEEKNLEKEDAAKIFDLVASVASPFGKRKFLAYPSDTFTT